MTEKEVYIVSAVRTPIGSFMGAFTDVPAHELGSVAVKEAVARAKISPEDVCEVIMGQALTAGQGQNPARNTLIKAGIPQSATAHIISMLCGSGLKAVASAYQAIRSGDSNVVVCGGQESMTRAPHVSFLRAGVKMGDTQLKDSMILDGLTDVFHNIHMGVTAENLATKYDISREDQDAYACESQKRVQKATEAGFFKAEIVPVSVKGPGRNAQLVSISQDEFPQKDVSIEALTKLRAVFKKDGTVTAGNASGINDGAAALVLMSKEEALKRGSPVLAKIIAYAQAGCDPAIMGIGPVPAVNALLKKAGWTKDEVDLWELNEAFAAQSLAVLKELKLNPSKVNIQGGAISLGHPIGASGARVLVTLLHALKRTGGKKGVAALCVGGGIGVSMAVECL
ncbi:acetyl-CoA acetyltransferase, cytosolic [Thrips palmi]|uniref:Acetyl-CoA acetyltransferase, cytosolic n=1 Tax=Thrips palmi TaxID=161013 RepID=A0A6P9A7I6_THRPL|nr:acetyl-CoA acetyltransferase, cytosolic [Thrips palmi]